MFRLGGRGAGNYLHEDNEKLIHCRQDSDDDVAGDEERHGALVSNLTNHL